MSADTPLTPILLTAIANSHAGFEERGEGRSPWVRSMLKEVGLPPHAPWSVAFVSHLGYASHMNPGGLGSSWPLPRVGNADRLAAFAKRQGILHAEPEIADIALIWAARPQRYVAAGIVMAAAPLGAKDVGRYRVTTIEGDVSAAGAPWKRGVFRVTRAVRPRHRMRFVRWVDLDMRDAVGDPAQANRFFMGRIVPAAPELRRCA